MCNCQSIFPDETVKRHRVFKVGAFGGRSRPFYLFAELGVPLKTSSGNVLRFGSFSAAQARADFLNRQSQEVVTK